MKIDAWLRRVAFCLFVLLLVGMAPSDSEARAPCPTLDISIPLPTLSVHSPPPYYVDRAGTVWIFRRVGLFGWRTEWVPVSRPARLPSTAHGSPYLIQPPASDPYWVVPVAPLRSQ